MEQSITCGQQQLKRDMMWLQMLESIKMKEKKRKVMKGVYIPK